MGIGGGGTTKTTTTPWKEAQPYLLDTMKQASALNGRQPSYYGGPLTVGATGPENQAWQTRNSFNNSVFGNAASPQYGDLTSSLANQMGGNTDIGRMSGALSPYATNTLTSGFKPADTSGITGLSTPGQTNAAGQIGNYGFGTSLDPTGKSPTFGVAGGLDARGAYNSMLSGQPDYAGVEGAIKAANDPLLRQFNEEVIPGLNTRATFTNNMTGGIKGVNRALPELADRMSENALSITEGERQRALGAQERAANAVSSGGFQGYGLGLNTAIGERGLEQNLAGMGLNADQARANLMLGDYNTGLQNSQFGLQQQDLLANNANQYRSDLLGLGSLGGSLAGNAGSQQQNAMSMFPGVYNLGRQPGEDALAYAGYDRGLREDALNADQTKFNYMRDQPYNNLSWYSNLINGIASPYGTQSGKGGGSGSAGAMGGLMALASLFGGS